MRWLRRLRRALRVLSPVPLSIAPTPWEYEDRVNLRVFLDSDTGQRLGAVLRQRLAIDAANAVTTPLNQTWSCGHAAGMQTMVAIVDEMANPGDEPQDLLGDLPSDSLDWLSTTKRHD